MKGSWQGFAAIAIFFLIIVLFLAAVTASPGAGILSGTNTGVVAPVVAPVVATPTNTPSVAALSSQSGGITYTVQPGEWLSSIARQFNTTAPAILAVNPQITDSDTIRPGQVIVIPAP